MDNNRYFVLNSKYAACLFYLDILHKCILYARTLHVYNIISRSAEAYTTVAFSHTRNLRIILRRHPITYMRRVSSDWRLRWMKARSRFVIVLKAYPHSRTVTRKPLVIDNNSGTVFFRTAQHFLYINNIIVYIIYYIIDQNRSIECCRESDGVPQYGNEEIGQRRPLSFKSCHIILCISHLHYDIIYDFPGRAPLV